VLLEERGERRGDRDGPASGIGLRRADQVPPSAVELALLRDGDRELLDVDGTLEGIAESFRG
jgi:hypothetical protein